MGFSWKRRHYKESQERVKELAMKGWCVAGLGNGVLGEEWQASLRGCIRSLAQTGLCTGLCNAVDHG